MSVFLAVVLLQVFIGIIGILSLDKVKTNVVPHWLLRALIIGSAVMAALMLLYLALTMLLLGGVR